MSEQTFTLNFKGFWRKQNIKNIPNEPGVYCIYDCTYNVDNDSITLHKLLYIGGWSEVRARITLHEHWDLLPSDLKFKHELCFSFARADSPNRQRIEAALIFKHKPQYNDNYRLNFPFDKTTIISTGKIGLLNTNFTVEKTEEEA